MAFPRIGEALERRRKAIEESIDAAERTRGEAEELLEEYRARLKEAREQADDIVVRARKAADAHADESKAEAVEQREELLAATRRDIEAETPVARRDPPGGGQPDRGGDREGDPQVAHPEDHRRLIEEALGEVDFSAWPGAAATATEPPLGGGDRRGLSRALFEVAREHGVLDRVHEELGEFADALDRDRNLQVFFFSLTSRRRRRRKASSDHRATATSAS